MATSATPILVHVVMVAVTIGSMVAAELWFIGEAIGASIGA